MYFYILEAADCPNFRCKLGITTRHPKYRLEEHRTSYVWYRYYAVYKFNVSLQELLNIEKKCLVATKDYRFDKTDPNNECREGLELSKLRELCELYMEEFELIDDIDSLPDEYKSEDKDTLFTSQTEFDNYNIHKPFPYKLRDFQVDVYDKMIDIYKNNISTKLKLYILCRCGKTILFQKFAYDYQDNYDFIIYVTHRLSLISDNKRRWEGILDYTIKEVSSSSDVSNEDILKFKSKTLVFVCDKSFSRIKHLLAKKVLIIFDEAHHISSKKTDDNPMIILKDKPIDYIFATATPNQGNFLDRSSIYMNDKTYFGNNEIKFYDIPRAIENKFMTNASLVIKEYGATLSNKQDTILSMINNLLNENLNYKPNKFLLYANTKKLAKKWVKILKENYGNSVYKYLSDCPNRVSARSLEAFRKNTELSFMVNCYKITDGIDIKELDVVVFLDPRYAKDNITQMIFRPRSYWPEKPNKHAYILIPSSIDNDDCKSVFSVIKELYKYNDPYTVKMLNNRSNSNKNTIDTELDMGDVIIDPNIYNKIIDLSNKTIFDKSVSGQILELLSDKCPRTIKEIIKELPIESKFIIFECDYLVTKGKLILDSDHYYLAERNNTISLSEFISKLKSLGIRCESEYHKYFSNRYDNNFPEIPTDLYDFKWKSLSLNSDIIYNLDETIKAIDEILLTHKDEVEKIIDNKELLLFFNSIDNRISTNINNLHTLHDIFITLPEPL
jgi:superfamily II DNA or RNA helicase